MAKSRELRAGSPFISLSSVNLSLHLVHLVLLFLILPSSFCPLPLSGNKAAFSFQSCPSIVGSGVRIQWSCRCRRPLWLHQYFLLCLSLSFLPPESSSGFSSALRPARLSSVVGFVRLLVRTVFSLVLCHDAVFGLSDRPSSSILLSPFLSPAQLLRVSSLGLQEHVTMSFVDEEKVDIDGGHLYTLQLLHHLANRL